MRRPATASRSSPASAAAAATLMTKRSPVVRSRRLRPRPPMVRLSLGRFVGGHPVVFVWVVEDGERWGQQEAILITTGSACLIHGAGGESEQLVEDGGRWVVRQRAQRSADHADAGGQPDGAVMIQPRTRSASADGSGVVNGSAIRNSASPTCATIASRRTVSRSVDRSRHGAVGAGFPGHSGQKREAGQRVLRYLRSLPGRHQDVWARRLTSSSAGMRPGRISMTWCAG